MGREKTPCTKHWRQKPGDCGEHSAHGVWKITPRDLVVTQVLQHLTSVPETRCLCFHFSSCSVFTSWSVRRGKSRWGRCCRPLWPGWEPRTAGTKIKHFHFHINIFFVMYFLVLDQLTIVNELKSQGCFWRGIWWKEAFQPLYIILFLINLVKIWGNISNVQ